MRRRRSIIGIVVLFGMLVGCSGQAVTPTLATPPTLVQQLCGGPEQAGRQEPLPAAIATILDPIVQEAMESIPLAGMSVAMQCASGPVYSRSYGYANLETRAPAQDATVYEVGSITKQFTAAAILQLVEQGKLHLDDPLSRFFAGFPPSGREIQVRHLLSHTSGLAEILYWHSTLGVKVDTSRAYTPGEIVAMIEQLPVQFTPGSRQVYNNSGYYLLGAIIEQVSGLDFGQYLQQHIFEPLGLSETSYCVPDLAGLAKGYRVVQGEFRPAEFVHPSLYYAPGGVCSTAGDLVRWQRALREGRVVSPESYQEMATPTTLTSGRQAPYGYGLALGKNAGRDVVYHGGQAIGFTGLLIYYPDEDLTLALLTNTLVPPDYTPEAWAAAFTTALFDAGEQGRGGSE
jgi:D-alanyl-D-alanine carboxypeptidase